MDSMNTQTHWENVYGTKAPEQVSWFRRHLETSLSLIERSTPNRSARIIDVGGGESTLVDDLVARGYGNLTVLDISQTAINVTKARLGVLADRIEWLAKDVTTADLPPNAYEIWHDRAVFHFLTTDLDRGAYVDRVKKSVRHGGHVIIGTFGPEGPTSCSGLEVQRYDADSLHAEFGSRFRLIDSIKELHQTPFGGNQQFLYCFCRVE
jgi:2-polyprenyl-3-methyl-5-hydroxy-6-metoxy-1,4-benzoquinol methylase